MKNTLLNVFFGLYGMRTCRIHNLSAGAFLVGVLRASIRDCELVHEKRCIFNVSSGSENNTQD